MGGPVPIPPAVHGDLPGLGISHSVLRGCGWPGVPCSVVGPGDPPRQWQRVAGAVVVTRSRVCWAGKSQGGGSEIPSHFPASQLFLQRVEGCRLRVSVILVTSHLCTFPPSPTHPRARRFGQHGSKLYQASFSSCFVQS